MQNILDNKSKQKVYGWGRSTYSNSFVFCPSEIKEVHNIVAFSNDNSFRIACRAAGRSYGDNTLNDDQIVLDITQLNKILKWDSDTGIITTQGGVTIEQVLLNCVESGWVFPAMPGTRFVTMAGALSNNVHGKNALHQGYIGEHVKFFKIILADNNVYYCSREQNKELFYSVISGLGLIGIIIEVSLQLKKVPSYFVAGKMSRHGSFRALVEGYEKIKHDYEYSIAWVDAIKGGAGLGRGEINYANFIDDGNFKITGHDIPKNIFGFIPNDWVPSIAKIFLNTTTMRFVNWLQVNTGNMSSDIQMDKVSLSKYHYLMDMKFPKYNYFFKDGFFLYQPILPVENTVIGYEELLSITHKYGFYSVMSAFKAYRQQNENFLLSFSLDGYSITLDIPKNPNRIKDQVKMFYEMNDCVIKYGGKIYLGKTPVLNKDHFFAMYDNVDEYLTIKQKVDPNNIFESNMYRRIMQISHENTSAPSIYSI